MKRTPPSNSPEPTGHAGAGSSTQAESNEVITPDRRPEPGPDRKKSEPLIIPPILLEGDDPGAKSKVEKQGQESDQTERSLTPQATALPESYGTGRLLLMARDPRCLYAHWDLNAQQQKHYRNLAENRNLELRVYRNAAGGQIVSEGPVAAESNHSFVAVEASATKYVAELGYYPAGAAWRTIARSEPVTTPMEAMGAEAPIQFATLTIKQEPPVTEAIPKAADGPTKNELRPRDPPTVTQMATEFPFPRSWRGTTAEPAREAETVDFLLPVEVRMEQPSESLSERMEVPIIQGRAGSEAVINPQWMRPAPVPERKWSQEHERQLLELSGWSSTVQRQLGSEEIEELLRGGAPKPEAGLAEAGVGISISSLGLAGRPPEGRREFWFSVNAELVIYGATEPDANVTIAGRMIRLRSDGTFSYRFSLPDGSYRLTLAAHSRHGDERVAELSFYRGTRYGGEVGAVVQQPGLRPPSAENVD